MLDKSILKKLFGVLFYLKKLSTLGPRFAIWYQNILHEKHLNVLR